MGPSAGGRGLVLHNIAQRQVEYDKPRTIASKDVAECRQNASKVTAP
jgi:hypothetical protein